MDSLKIILRFVNDVANCVFVVVVVVVVVTAHTLIVSVNIFFFCSECHSRPLTWMLRL